MKRLPSLLTACFFLTLTIPSCKREQLTDPTTPPQPAVKTQAVQIASAFDKLDMLYNTDGSVKETKLSTPRGLLERAQFLYEAGKLATVSYTGVQFAYTYQNDRLASIKVYTEPGAMTSIYEYNYQNNLLAERIKRVKVGPSGQLQPYSKTVYHFSPEGNLARTETFSYSFTGSSTLTEVVNYTYDDKENTVSNFEAESFLHQPALMKNNPVKIVYTNELGEDFKTITHSYTYNQFGQPVTRKTIVSAIGFGGTTTDYTISYAK